MATLTRQASARTGTSLTFASCAAGGDVVTNADGKTFLLVVNGSGGALTVTVAAQVTSLSTPYGTLEMSNKAKSVGAGETAIIGPFEPTLFNNSSNQLAITYSGVTSLTIAACYLP